MNKIIGALIALTLSAACATGPHTQRDIQEIRFETGKGKRAVMDAIVQVATDDGFEVGSTSQKEGAIVFKPRKMLDGILSQKISDSNGYTQTKRATLNHQIQFSATVSAQGGVALKTLVMVSGLDGPIDRDKSKKLGRHYEKKIMNLLNTHRPKILMRITPITA